jgi:hypothetical protein
MLMIPFNTFAKARRKKSAEGVRPVTDAQRPNSSGENTGSAGNRIEEARKKDKRRDKNPPTQNYKDIGMVSPMKPAPDNVTGNMVGDQINSP